MDIQKQVVLKMLAERIALILTCPRPTDEEADAVLEAFGKDSFAAWHVLIGMSIGRVLPAAEYHTMAATALGFTPEDLGDETARAINDLGFPKEMADLVRIRR